MLSRVYSLTFVRLLAHRYNRFPTWRLVNIESMLIKVRLTRSKCANCNWELATLPGEVDVRFIALLSLFDRTQGPVDGRKAGRLT